jgi:hypothetical protein
MLTLERSGRGIGRTGIWSGKLIGREKLGSFRPNRIWAAPTDFICKFFTSADEACPLGFHLRGGSTLKDGLQLHRAIRVGWRQVGLPHCCGLDRNASYLLGLARSVDHSKQIITFARSLDAVMRGICCKTPLVSRPSAPTKSDKGAQFG